LARHAGAIRKIGTAPVNLADYSREISKTGLFTPGRRYSPIETIGETHVGHHRRAGVGRAHQNAALAFIRPEGLVRLDAQPLEHRISTIASAMRLVHFSATMSSGFHALSTNGLQGPEKTKRRDQRTPARRPTTIQRHIARTTSAASLSQMSSSTHSQCAQVREAVNATLSPPTGFARIPHVISRQEILNRSIYDQ
jgi:hypothetical protein